MATIREVSEKIRDHLTQQKARSVGDTVGGTCRYLDSKGNKCAVGCLIPEGKYDAMFEGATIYGGYASAQELRDLLADTYGLELSVHSTALHVLRDWQMYHDSGDYRPWVEGGVMADSPAHIHAAIMKRHGVE